MKRKVIGTIGAISVGLLLSSCVSFSGDSAASDDTAVMAIRSDIGNLDPVSQSSNDLTQFKNLTYDRVINENPSTGVVEPGLASAWVDGLTEIRFTINNTAVCDDGTGIDAEVVAANYRRIVAEGSTSSWKGNAVPADLEVKVEGNDVVLSTAKPFLFFVKSAGGIPVICQAGLDDEDALTTNTFGTGPFVLDKVVSGSEYQLVKRDGYTWGPNGESTSEEGFPDRLILKIVANETTAVNLLLSGELNIATIQGPDRARLDAAGMDYQSYEIPLGEWWFNHDEGRVTASENVRRAIAQAVNLEELGQVVTAGAGTVPKSTMTLEPVACPADVVAGNIPSMDPGEAKKNLEKDGWTQDSSGKFMKDGKPLGLRVIYPTKWGQTMADAAELMLNQLRDFGIDAEIQALDAPATSAAIFGDGNFDIAWNPFTMDNPRLLVPLVMGENPRNGGLNFGSVHNAEHDALAAEATLLPGDESCPKWNAAEESLIKQLNVIPFQSGEVPIYTNGVTATVSRGSISPWSIRINK